MRRLKVFVIVAILMLSLVPLGFESVSATNGSPIPQANVTNTTAKQRLAEKILEIVEGLHNMARAIENVTVPANACITEHYQLAEEYRMMMEEAYQNGNYSEAIARGLLAMHQYKGVLRNMEEFRERLIVSMERMEGYFKNAERTIIACDKVDLDTTTAWELFNETKNAYRVVLEDLKEGNLTRAEADFERARELKNELDKELERLRKCLTYANANRIVSAFLERGEKAIDFIQKVIANASETGANTTKLQGRLMKFERVYSRVRELAAQGNYTGAMSLIMGNWNTVKEFQGTLELVLKKVKERRIKEGMENLKAFENEIQERIKEATKVLDRLKRRGVNTKEVEIKLMAATQEFKMGFELAKRGDLTSAEVHFEMGLELLHGVEEFIVRHS